MHDLWKINLEQKWAIEWWWKLTNVCLRVANDTNVECFHNNESLVVSGERQISVPLYSHRLKIGNPFRINLKIRRNKHYDND